MPSPIDDLTDRLVHARLDARAAPALAPADAAAAYAVQDAVAQRLGWFTDGPPRFWKSGAGSLRAEQTHAPLPPAGVLASPGDARTLAFHARGIEAELALRLREPIDAARADTLDLSACRALIDAVCVSIEIVDSRWVEGADAPALARLADLQSHGALVLGDWQPFADRDWRAQPCEVRIGGAPARRFVGTHPLGDPCQVLPAFLRHAAARLGVVPAGTVVTTGTWCGLLQAAAGDAIEVRFDGIGQAMLAF